MPLSKARDKERKRLEKKEEDRIRLEKVISPPQRSEPVQPEMVEVVEEWTPTEHKLTMDGVRIVRPHYYGQTPVVELDADGNVIPEGEWT